MKYCWEIFNKSECETCEYFCKFSAGTLNIESVKDIVIIDD